MVDIKDIYWVAGFIEGEGSFTQRGYTQFVIVAQVQREPLERLRRFFGGKIFFTDRYRESHPNWQPVYRWYVSNAAARGVMMTIYPLMSPRRQVQIRKVLDLWRSRLRRPQYRTHCPRGHAYEGKNLMINKSTGGRYCRTCANGLRYGFEEEKPTIQ
jgi:hypothetical protein